MMGSFRTIVNHLVLKIILALIILSFVLTGAESYLHYRNRNYDYIVKINSQEVSRTQFERAFDNERRHQQEILGQQFYQLESTEDYIQQMRQQVLSRIIDEILLEQYANKDLKLSISDEQIKQAIFIQPDFLTNGKFDNDKYLDIINRMGFSTNHYAEMLRKQLAIQQLIYAIASTDFILKNEIDTLTALLSQQRVVRQATLNINTLIEKYQVSEEEVKDYYTQNKDSFLESEQFRVRYLKLDVNSMQPSVSESDIQSWYEEHKSDYIQPQRKRYSIIQLKKKEEAQVVLEQLRNGSAFAALAKARSVDPISMRNGGDIGWIESSTMIDELKNANLTIKGQLSDVVQSSVGFLIISLDDIQSEKLRPLDEVHDIIANKVKQKKAFDIYHTLQQKARNMIVNHSESLVNAERETGIKTIETGWFDRENIPEDLKFKLIEDAIFNGSLPSMNGLSNRDSDLITINDGCAFILSITGHKPKTIKLLDDVKIQIINTLKYKKAEQEAKIQVEKILSDLKVGKQEALLSAGLKFGRAKTMTHNDQSAITQVVFALPHPKSGKSVYGVSEDIQGNIVFLALDKVETKDLSQTQKKAMAKGILQNNIQITFDTLLSNLRERAKIKFSSSLQL